jgi:hypothetical protein
MFLVARAVGLEVEAHLAAGHYLTITFISFFRSFRMSKRM